MLPHIKDATDAIVRDVGTLSLSSFKVPLPPP